MQCPDEWFVIVAPLRGSCQIEGQDAYGRRTVSLVPGEISLIAPRNPVRLGHSPARRTAFEVACIRLSTQVLRHAFDMQPVKSGVGDPMELHTLRAFDPHVASMAPLLLSALAAGASVNYLISAARYLAMHLVHPQSDVTQRRGGLTPEQLRTVTAYMNEHMNSDITLARLAEIVMLSRYHFIRQFSAATGKTPLRYLTELRIQAARQLLASDGNEPVSQVGRRCGFPNPANFARVFRKNVGCSPSQYRQRAA
ncbi:helix-turn-helix domain-containing protein [Streptomyces sp. NPDC003442]